VEFAVKLPARARVPKVRALASRIVALPPLLVDKLTAPVKRFPVKGLSLFNEIVPPEVKEEVPGIVKTPPVWLIAPVAVRVNVPVIA